MSVKPQSVSVDAETFKKDTDKWSEIVSDIYLERLAVNWSSVRNVMDMNAGFGGCVYISLRLKNQIPAFITKLEVDRVICCGVIGLLLHL